MIAAVAEGIGLGIIYDDELLPQARVVRIPIRGKVMSSRDEIICMAERRASQLIAGFFAIAQEFVDERASNRRAAREAEVPAKLTQPKKVPSCSEPIRI